MFLRESGRYRNYAEASAPVVILRTAAKRHNSLIFHLISPLCLAAGGVYEMVKDYVKDYVTLDEDLGLEVRTDCQ